MPKWREKAKSVRAQGEIQRRDWNPPSDSVHLRMYQWWQARSSRAEDISRENFCHYWRVVMIWAPLRWLGPKLLALLIAAAVAALIVGICIYGSPIAIGAGLGIYAMFGIYVAAYLTDKYLMTKTDSTLGNFALLKQLSRVPYALIVLAALPVVVVIGVPAVVVGLAVYIVYSLHVEHGIFDGLIKLGGYFKNALVVSAKAVGRAVKWLFVAHFSDRIWLTWIRPYLLIPASFAVLGYWHDWAKIVALALVGVTIGVCVVLALSYLADEAKRASLDRRSAAIKVEMDKFFHNMFALQHPKYAGDDIRYQKWFARYSRFMKNRYGEDVYDEHAPIERFFFYEDGLIRKYFDTHGRFRGQSFALHFFHKSMGPIDKPKKKRQSGVVEFLAFVWSVVLVNKWKICPIVEIPERV